MEHLYYIIIHRRKASGTTVFFLILDDYIIMLCAWIYLTEGGFVLGASNAVQLEVPKENYLAMIQAWEEHGHY